MHDGRMTPTQHSTQSLRLEMKAYLGKKKLKLLFKLSMAGTAGQSAVFVCNCAAALVSGEQLRVVGGAMHKRAGETKY